MSTRVSLWSGITGLLVIGLGGLLAWRDATEWLTLAVVAIGGVLINPPAIIGLVKAWRSKRNSQAARWTEPKDAPPVNDP